MPVDPVLVTWVPKWVREQHERANSYFRRVLGKMLGEVCASNHWFLLRLWRRMVSRHERVVSRKSRDGKKKTGSGFSSSDSSQEGTCGESECEEGARDEVRAA